jgi:DNA repair exonuclease SbcCD ATPase subunit
MIIRRLYLKDFGCIVEQTFLFDHTRSVFMLHGRNGRGKTTIFQALGLLLIDDTTDTLEDLIRWGTKEFILEIDFEYDGHSYSEKIVCDGSATRTLIIDGDTANPFKNSDAIKRLAQVFDPRMFKASAFAVQNKIDIVSTTPADRRDYLMRVYDLDFKRSVENLETSQRQVEETLLNLKTERLGLENTQYDLLEVFRPPFGSSGLLKRQSEADDLQRFLTLVESEVESTKVLQRTIEDLEEQSPRLQESRRVAEQSLKDNQSAVDKSQGDQQLESSQLESTLDDERLRLVDDQKRLEGLVSTKPEFIEDPSFSTAVDEARDRLQQTTSSITQVKASIELHLQGKCPTCGNTFDGHDLPSLQDELDRLLIDQAEGSDQLSRRKQSLLAYEGQKRDHDRDLTVWTANSSSLSSAQQKLVEFDQSAEVRRSQLKSSQKRYHDQLVSMTAVLTANLRSAEASCQDLDRQLIAKRTELAARPVTDDLVVSEKTDRLEVVRAELKSYSDVLASNLLAETTNAALLVKQSVNKTRIEELIDLISKEEMRLSHHVAAIKIFKRDFPSFIVSSLIDGIVQEMDRFLEQAYNKYKINLKEVKTGIKITYGPNEADVSRASGYEKQVFSSAWRHARERLTGYGIAFLDEADSSSDRENAELFYRTLMSTDLYDNGQLIIISHKDETRQLLEQEFEAGIFEIA